MTHHLLALPPGRTLLPEAYDFDHAARLRTLAEIASARYQTAARLFGLLPTPARDPARSREARAYLAQLLVESQAARAAELTYSLRFRGGH